MNRSVTFASGLGLGAAVMFLFDPAVGGRRRAVLRDKGRSAISGGRRYLQAAAKDLSNRVRGTFRELQPHEERLFAGDDDVLVDRVRTAFGRVVSHPGAVHVMIENGTVRLDGAILSSELRPLMSAILNVEGVHSVDNRLKVCETAKDVPGLQGTGSLRRRRLVPRAPGARLAMGLAGGAVLAAVVKTVVAVRS